MAGFILVHQFRGKGCRLAGLVLLGQTREELEAFAVSLSQPAFRGKQLYDGILHGATSVAAISNVSISIS